MAGTSLQKRLIVGTSALSCLYIMYSWYIVPSVVYWHGILPNLDEAQLVHRASMQAHTLVNYSPILDYLARRHVSRQVYCEQVQSCLRVHANRLVKTNFRVSRVLLHFTNRTLTA